ncbi:MAG: hypothetical protein WCR66_10865 [Bacteroidota bacterium]
MKSKLIVAFILLSHLCIANMASPIREGSKNASAFSSKDVNILHENIVVHISSDFKTAKYTIEYLVESDLIGGQIPLLFLAKDYKDDFNVWVDDQRVNILDIPNYIIKPKDSPFEKFSNSFNDLIDSNQYLSITWIHNNNTLYNLDDLKFFKTNLQKGIHKIKVEYTAKVWVYYNEWLKNYSFRYSLEPAKYWKSFGGLSISIIQDYTSNFITTNLGNPNAGISGLTSNWKFNTLPGDLFIIEYKPVISNLAQTLISIGPYGIMIFCGILFFALHFVFVFWYRKKHLVKRFSWVLIAGSFVVPYLILHSLFLSYDMIDKILGEDASRRHGYYFLILFWYPIMVICYLAIMWLLDTIVKRNLQSKG